MMLDTHHEFEEDKVQTFAVCNKINRLFWHDKVITNSTASSFMQIMMNWLENLDLQTLFIFNNINREVEDEQPVNKELILLLQLYIISMSYIRILFSILARRYKFICYWLYINAFIKYLGIFVITPCLQSVQKGGQIELQI